MTPMTLSEFLDSLDRSAVRAYDAEGEETPVSDVVRPLVLRLLAGERERCAETVASYCFEYNHLRRRYLSATAQRALNAVLAMGDPT